MKSTFGESWQEFRADLRRTMKGLAKAHLFRIFAFLLTLTVIGAVVLWVIEGRETFPNPFDALWWSLVTVTTVGYGDISPHQPFGKVAAMLVILSGVVLVSMFTATVSSVLVATKIREDKGLEDVYYKNHLIIAGWHPGAEKLLEALRTLSNSAARLVLLNDLEPSAVETILDHFSDLKPKFVRGDYGSEAVLRRAGVVSAGAVILLPDMKEALTAAQVDQKTILASLMIKDINPQVKVYAYALEAESIPHMRRGGVDRVVPRDAYAGFFLACHALAPGVPEVLDELLTLDKGHRIDRLPIPETLVGKTVEDVRHWVKDEVGGIMIGLVVAEKVIDVDDILSDDLSSIDAFIKRKFEEAGRSPEELATTRIQINPDPEKIVTRSELAVVIRQVGRTA